MSGAEGARTFRVAEEAYERFMGRYSRPLAREFADAVRVEAGQSALDVGCGTGALTAELVRRLGARSVSAVDPSEPFVEACHRRHPEVDVHVGEAEALPFDDDSFDVALAQLVFHFMADPLRGARELGRVVRPAGRVGACVWDFDGGMTMLSAFWDAAREVDPDAPSETTPFGKAGELGHLFQRARLASVETGALEVAVDYEDFDDLWRPFLGGVGPAGAYCASLDTSRRDAVRTACFRRLGSPEGPFTLTARAWYAVGRA